MPSYDKMNTLYEAYAGAVIETKGYTAVVSGFHFEWDDRDHESIIATVTEDRTGHNRAGLRYYQQGDVFRNSWGPLGFVLIPLSEINRNYQP